MSFCLTARVSATKIMEVHQYILPASSIVDPHWLQCGSGSQTSILDQCGSGSRVLMTPQLQNLQLEKVLCKKIPIFVSLLKSPRRTSQLQEKHSALKREHPALQNM